MYNYTHSRLIQVKLMLPKWNSCFRWIHSSWLFYTMLNHVFTSLKLNLIQHPRPIKEGQKALTVFLCYHFI